MSANDSFPSNFRGIDHRKLGEGEHLLFCPGCYEKKLRVVISDERQTAKGIEPATVHMTCDACCVSQEYPINGDEI